MTTISTEMGGRQRSVVSVSERSGTLWSDFARPQRQLTLANVFRKCLPRRVGVGEMKALIEQSEALGNAQQHWRRNDLKHPILLNNGC